jgi:hypothetical protein
MKIVSRVILSFFCAVFILQCGRGKRDNVGAKAPQHAPCQLTTFTPPSDSAISTQQMTAWFNCNHALDSLSAFFTESLSSNNPELTDSAQKYLLNEQNRLCVTKGLTGGYQEYLWILDNLGSSRNKAAYDSMTSDKH